MMDFVKRFRHLFVALFFLLAALLFFAYHLRREVEPSIATRALLQISLPIHRGAQSVLFWVRGIGERYLLLTGVEEENQRLRRELSSLRAENNRLQEALLTENRMQKLVPLEKEHSFSLVAQVFARDPSSWFKTVLVDKGEADGVSKDMAVAVAEGLVGRVIEVFPNTSKVLLITDPNSAVDVIIQSTRAQGIMEGRVEDFCILKYVKKSDEVQVGDKIITSGLGGIFPKGLLAATITKVERKRPGIFQYVEVMPTADLSRLEEVLILGEEP
jgi:rod shape-determining protein MreC